MNHPDLIVVGAGIIGLSAAFRAAEAGLQVRVLGAEPPGDGGATAVAAGMLAPLAEAHDMPDDLVQHGVESSRLYPDFIRRVQAASGESAGFLDRGTLLVAADRDQAGELEQLARAHARLDLPVERWTVRQVLRHEPRVSARIAGGLFCPADHAVHPRIVARALAAAIRALGGTLSQVQVHAIDETEADVAVHTAMGEVIRGKRVLVAAGLGSQALLGDRVELGLRPVKGQVLRLTGEALLTGVVRTPRVYLVPRSDGLVVGASEEEMGLHSTPLAGVTLDLLYEAWRTVPGVYELELDAITVGHRPSTRDGRPVVGPVTDRIFVAAGHHRHGVLLAPWTADRLAQQWGLV